MKFLSIGKLQQWCFVARMGKPGTILLSIIVIFSIIGLIKRTLDTQDIHLHFLKSHSQEGNYEKAKSIRLLCFLMTHSARKKNVMAVKETWGKRCDKFILIMDVEDNDLGSIRLDGVKEGRHFLWGKARESFKYMYDHYLNEFDWFYNADYDTYLIVENLKYVLTAYDPDFPIALGERFLVSGNIRRSYLGGGAGYALSRGALKVFGEIGYPNSSLCKPTPDGADDTMMGICMNRSGIMFGDTRDEFGQHRFYQNRAEDYIEGLWSHWYPRTMKYPYRKGIESLPETAVSFHNMKRAANLYVLEFFIYKLQLFGVNGRYDGPSVVPFPPDTSSIPAEVLERFGHPTLNKDVKDIGSVPRRH